MATGAQGVWNVDWLNANSQRNYPLHEDATRLDTSASFQLPNDFLVDMIFPVQLDPSIDPTLFHVLSIGIFGAGVTISIGYNGVLVGSAAIDASTFTRNQMFFIQGTGQFFDTVGKIVVGTLDTVLQSAGSFTFDVAGGRLEQTVIKPDIRGVNAIYLSNNGELSAAIQGDVILEAGTNFLLNIFPGLPGEPDRIVFNAIDGAGLSQGCECDENATLPCITTIDGISPDGSGNFTLLGDSCLSLDGIANGLQLKDDCAQPCCGCAELKVLTDTLNFMVQQVNSLQNLATRIESTLLVTQTNLLSSKTGTLK